MSKKLVEEKLGDRKAKPTHDRLYDLNKIQQEKLRQKQNDVMNEYIKQSDVSMHKASRANLDHTLYQDAERRRLDLQKKKEDLDKQRFASHANKPYKNENSDKYVIKRLERELQHLE